MSQAESNFNPPIRRPFDQTIAMPFYKIPVENDQPLFQVQPGMSPKYAKEIVGLILDFLRGQTNRAIGNDEGLEAYELWIQWFLLDIVSALRESTGETA